MSETKIKQKTKNVKLAHPAFGVGTIIDDYRGVRVMRFENPPGMKSGSHGVVPVILLDPDGQCGRMKAEEEAQSETIRTSSV